MSMLAGMLGGGSLSGSGGAGGQSGPATSGGGTTGQETTNIISAGGGFSSGGISQILQAVGVNQARQLGALGNASGNVSGTSGFGLPEIAVVGGLAAIAGLVAFVAFRKRGSG